MINRYDHGKIKWLDVDSPSKDEVKQIAEEFKIDSIVIQELLVPTYKPKVEVYNHYIYLILHFPGFKNLNYEKEIVDQEIDFIAGKDFIITTHYGQVDPLHRFSRLYEVNSILERGELGPHAGYIFAIMIKQLYMSLVNQLDYVGELLKDIESRIFKGNEKDMVFALSNVSKILMDFKRITIHHEDVLNSLEVEAGEFYGNHFEKIVRSVKSEFYKIHNSMESRQELMSELRETNNSIVSTKQNEVMKVLTIMAFVTFPLSLIASIFGMNTKTIPIIGFQNDFWIIIGIMAGATFLMFLWFKYKKWL